MKRGVIMEKGSSEIGNALKELCLAEYEENSKEISTPAFLRLSNLLILVLDKIGPTMIVLRQDIQRNAERLEDIYVSDPAIYHSLQEILNKESSEGTVKKPGSCSKAVVWLTRSYCLGIEVLKGLIKDGEMSLNQVVDEAYKRTLQPWHGWISSAAYKIAQKLIPEREVFIRLLVSQGQDYEELKGDIQKYILLVQPCLDQLNVLMRDFRLDKLKST